MSDRTTGSGWRDVMLVVALTVLSIVLLAAALVAVRADRQLRGRIAAMPGGDEPAAMWPLNLDDTESGPYLRGATVASALTGRR